jgi:Lactate racemase N-terminal domain
LVATLFAQARRFKLCISANSCQNFNDDFSDTTGSIGRHPGASRMPFKAAYPRDFMQESQRCISRQHASCLKTVGTIPAVEIAKITDGLMSQDVPVSLHKRIFDYDQISGCGPVFPHEVVGFSGGSKYFFPGIGGPDIINFCRLQRAFHPRVASRSIWDTSIPRASKSMSGEAARPKASCLCPGPARCFTA